MAQLIKKARDFIADFMAHWNVPYKGRHVPNKEIIAYSIGGIGVHFVTVILGIFTLNASNLFLGSCLDIRPTHLQYMLTIANVLGFAITAVRSYCYDNVKSKYGKFRPYLKWMGIPTVLISVIFVWLPYDSMEYMTKLIVIEIMYLLVNCFSPFYSESFAFLLQVMSPDSDERTDVMSISQIIYSIAPSITNLLIPILAQATGGLTSINTYRIIYPIVSIFGLFIAFPVYKYTSERIIKPRSQENEIRFFDAIRSIVKNKYYWIINIALWIGFLEGSYGVILQWSFVYAYPEKEALLGVVQTLIGNGALYSMIAAPFFIRKFGKRNMLIGCNIINILLLAALYPFHENIWVVITIFYVNNFVGVLGNIYNPGIQADMKDYQQYISGERIDGMFGIVGMIGTILGFGTGFISPWLYERCGVTDNYDVLYDSAIRNDLFKTLIIASVAGAILNVIPYLFYDLTEKKQRGITHVLKIRAMFDDFSSGVLEDSTLISAMEIINTAKASFGKAPETISKDAIKTARLLPKNTREEKEFRKAQIKKAKEELIKAKQKNLDIELSPFIMEEMNKFTTERYLKQVETADFLLAHSDSDLGSIYSELKMKKNATPAEDKDSKKIKADISSTLRKIKSADKIRRKYYSDGLTEPDENALKAAQNMETDSFIKALQRKIAVKQELKEKSNYRLAKLPFTEAQKTRTQYETYLCMDKLEEMYSEILQNKKEAEINI